MAAITRKFASNVAATQLTNITTEQFFSTIPSLSVDEGCVVQIEANPVASPTDDLIVAVYGRQDGTNFDITPLFEFTIDRANDPGRLTFVVKDVFEFRVGVRRSGTTDTITSADMDSRLWQWESA